MTEQNNTQQPETQFAIQRIYIKDRSEERRVGKECRSQWSRYK